MKLFWIILLGLSTCQRTTIADPPAIQGNSQGSSSKKEMLCKKWRLSQEISGSDVEPYGPDTTNYSSGNDPKNTWEINQDGSYIMYSDYGANTEKGIWAFNDDSTMLGKKVDEYNGQTINSTITFDNQIVELTDTLLKLKFQGRAGDVYQVFIPYTTPDKNQE